MVASSGARAWAFLRIPVEQSSQVDLPTQVDLPHLALANYIGGVTLFPWTNSSSPIDESRKMRLPGTDGAAGLAVVKTFDQFGVERASHSLLAVARYPPASSAPGADVGSVVMSLFIDPAAGPTVKHVQTLDTRDAYAVVASRTGGAHYLVFASMSSHGSSVYAWGPDASREYAWGTGSLTPSFSRIQTLPTERAAGLHAFSWRDTPYVLVAQVHPQHQT